MARLLRDLKLLGYLIITSDGSSSFGIIRDRLSEKLLIQVFLVRLFSN
jgi:hypothetical protein